MKKSLLIIAMSLAGLGSVAARAPLYDKLWSDPEIEHRINSGIEMYRKGFGTLNFVDAKGAPLTDVSVELDQTRHDFLFGCNLFMLGQYPTAEKNRAYEEIFPRLFNFAFLPFYWSDLEPEPGKLRFAKDSPPIYRRPPPDLCLEYCRLHDITPKGHLLIWQEYLPKWLPNDRQQVKELMIKRFKEIADRYGNEIKYWDVIDEALYRDPGVVLPNDYVYTAMQEAARAFPPTCSLQIGDRATGFLDFHYEDSPFYLLLDNLRLRNARFDALAPQFLMVIGYNYGGKEYKELPAGTHFPPKAIYSVLDQYADFQRPIFISQVTIPSAGPQPESEEDQAVIVRNLYRLWFSHPSVESISWWNLPDGTALGVENASLAGLLREDLSPKPAFKVLENLIRKEWWTRIKEKTSTASELRIHGFYGSYRLTATHGGKTVRQDIHLTKNGINKFEIRFP